MYIYGLTKTTLLDYPGHVACTIFTGGCNLRCVYCHNYPLATMASDNSAISMEELFSFLKKRNKTLQGICVSGGEPTVSEDLDSFLLKLKVFNLPIKLDTNGLKPDVLKKLCENKLIDYIAMDIKGAPEKYPFICGIPSIDLSLIEKSVAFIKACSIPHEFRTTVTADNFSTEDFTKIGQLLKSSSPYFLQYYTESAFVPDKKLAAPSPDMMKAFADTVRPFVPNVKIRGES